MTEVLKEVDYKHIFKFFEEISAVPRGSRNNQGISDYLVRFAKDRNLYYEQDALGNVIIIKEATKGYENSDAVILQGHMDMVCIKDPEIIHDFFKDGLKIVVEGDYIHATGTTLGGDNGIAIAYSLALLDSDEFVHPRLEVIITTDEEIGLLGATALDTKCLQAKYMINLDSEEESSILVGCAGGQTSICTLPLTRKKKSGQKVDITICGLQGGHSGIEIDRNRTNGVLLLARMLMELEKTCTFEVETMSGGQKDNAIPSEAYVSLVVEEEMVSVLQNKVSELETIYKKELHASEKNVTLRMECKDNGTFSCLERTCYDQIITFILHQPNGIQTMSADIKGLVESSLNLGIFEMKQESATFSYSVRSSIATYKEFMNDKMKRFTELLGGTYTVEGAYPAWEYNPDSRLRELMVELYRKEFGREPIIEAIHAGLECGILASKLPGLDIVSIGPDMYDVHTPKERLSISSTIRVFDYLTQILETLAKLK